MSLFDLSVHKADARHECLDMGAGRFNRSPGNLHSRFAQYIQNMGGVEAPDAVAFQQFSYRPLADARGLAGCGCEFPQVEQPGAAKIAFEFQHGGKVAPKLLAPAVGEPVTLRAKIACNVRHSPSSMTVGSRAASSRKRCGSVRKAEAITSASRLSSLAPASVAFLSWIRRPEPTGSRRATPASHFQHSAGDTEQ